MKTDFDGKFQVVKILLYYWSSFPLHTFNFIAFSIPFKFGIRKLICCYFPSCQLAVGITLIGVYAI